MRPRPNRLEHLPEQYFSRLLTRVAEAAQTGGEPLVDLGRGNPDVPPPAHVAERLAAAAATPKNMSQTSTYRASSSGQDSDMRRM